MSNKTKKIYGKAIVTIEDLIVKYLQFVKLETPAKITTAQEPGAYASLDVIQDDQGDLFFVGKQLFN